MEQGKLAEHFHQANLWFDDDLGPCLHLSAVWIPQMRNDFPFKGFFVGFWILWVVGALLSFSAMACIVYILYRVATHPW
jgi:hypothetical protein